MLLNVKKNKLYLNDIIVKFLYSRKQPKQPVYPSGLQASLARRGSKVQIPQGTKISDYFYIKGRNAVCKFSRGLQSWTQMHMGMSELLSTHATLSVQFAEFLCVVEPYTRSVRSAKVQVLQETVTYCRNKIPSQCCKQCMMRTGAII
jgi:hypothetical protein